MLSDNIKYHQNQKKCQRSVKTMQNILFSQMWSGEGEILLVVFSEEKLMQHH